MRLPLPSARRLLLLAGLAAVVVALGLWLALRGTPADAVAARYAPLVRTLQFSARVATLSRVDVGPTVTGRVSEVLVREGDAVRAGQVLVRLESEEPQAALAQAIAAERQAQARLAGLRSTGRSASQAQLEQADANLTAAQAELRRTEQLVAQGFLSAQRLDDGRRAVQVAEAQREAALAQSRANADRGTDVVQAQAQLQAAAAATSAARARLAQAVLIAPAAARVLSREVEPGQIVQPGKALVGLALAGPTQIVAQVDERFLEQLRAGQKAAVVADAFAGQRMDATVASIAPEVDAQRGAVEVKLALDRPPPAFLREDMTLSVEVETARRERALVLPARALRSGAAGDVLLVADGRRAAERPVRIGLRTLDAVEILEGVKEGDLVLLGPAVRAGARVRPQTVDWQPARSPQARGSGAGDPMGGLTQAVGR
ncbi:MAG: efflux RND transporter periplasmic adaptor subunit [Comamonadaceae bacterium]|nr:MAG: efflux RND transporter periplasmic adaptor subunit [Comamonadaceae bacterium]